MSTASQESQYLLELFQRFDRAKLVPFVAEFTHATSGSVEKWIAGRFHPKGEKLTRLRVLLDLLGYRVKAFDELVQPVKELARSIALDLVTVDEAREMLRYTDEKALFDLVVRGGGMQVQRQYPLERFVERSADELAEATSRFREEFKEKFGIEAGIAADQPGGDSPGSGAIPASDTPADTPQPKPSILSSDSDETADALTSAIRLVEYTYDAATRQTNPGQVRHEVRANIGDEKLESVINALTEVLVADH